MDKNRYLQELEAALRGRKVSDVDEILDEYTQHFEHKAAEGFTEEETAARLGDPAAVAEQFRSAEQPPAHGRSGGKALLAVGLGFTHLFAGSGFLVLFCCVLVLGALALASFTLGGCLVAGANIAGLLPPMPYFGALLFGLSFFALGVLGAVGTLQLELYSVQWIRVYARWTRNTMGGGRYPPLSVTPRTGRRLGRAMRLLTVVSLVLFLVLAVAAWIALTVHVGSMEFWHALGWFGYTG